MILYKCIVFNYIVSILVLYYIDIIMLYCSDRHGAPDGGHPRSPIITTITIFDTIIIIIIISIHNIISVIIIIIT